jgi:hypothetical protein
MADGPMHERAQEDMPELADIPSKGLWRGRGAYERDQ